MPKIHDNAVATKRPLIEQQKLGTGKASLRQSLIGASYEEGALALGLDPQTLGGDPQDLGLDPKTLTEDLATIFKQLQPAYDFYLRAKPQAGAVQEAYANEKDKSGRGSADGRFTIGLNELVGRVVSLCNGAEFMRASDLTSRNRMSKEQRRTQAAEAALLLQELERLVAALALMAAQVQASPESTRQMQLAMLRVMEVRSAVAHTQRTFHSEGVQIGAKPVALDTEKPAP